MYHIGYIVNELFWSVALQVSFEPLISGMNTPNTPSMKTKEPSEGGAKPLSAVHEAMRPENIGKRLHLLRVAFGKNKMQMARELDMHRVYWNRFESGERAITNQFAGNIIDRYGVTLDWLILGRIETLPLELADRIREAEADIKKS